MGKSLTPEFDTDHEDTDAFAESQAALALCYASAARGVDITGERAGQPSLRLIDQDIVQRSEPAAVVQGVNVHAATAVDGRDRKRLERLCRYLARPPIAQDRLELLADGRVHYTLKKAWSPAASPGSAPSSRSCASSSAPCSASRAPGSPSNRGCPKRRPHDVFPLFVGSRVA